MVCYRAGDDTGEFAAENRKESKDHLSDPQASLASGFLSKPLSTVG